MFKSLVALSLTVSAALAQQAGILSVTSPLQGTVYTAGQTALISWINPTVDTISQIVLASGSATALQPVAVIATNVSAADGSFSWAVPANISNGNTYAFEFGTSPDLAYSPMFVIQGGSGGNTTAPPPPSSSVVMPSSSASAASASSSVSTASTASASASATASKSDATRKTVALGMVAMIVGTAVTLY
ncbi:hypothetical protein DM01DRAFT_1330919, partial [Hesseltinella vesiculosa]